MEISTFLSIFIAAALLGITGYSIYTAFGPPSKNLRDPFEEHED
uniref:Protein PsbN n=1 Tax=Cyanophora paradoxa TaxID=2762 RepID=A0A097PBK0_CYAPA|nr:photosystem II protein N [Cyanophora paradoxa]